MSASNLNDYPFHEISGNTNSVELAVLIVGLIKFMLLQILLHSKVVASIFSAIQSWVFDEELDGSTKNVDGEKKVGGDDDDDDDDDDETIVCGGEMEMVLGNLGIHWQGKLPARVDAEAIFEVFEERNPSLDEVREAFDVFDENRDGFIDEKELQRVLCGLGFKEGLEMENCRRMIGRFDEDGDGKIDFHEFVKFMEINSLI